MTELKDKQNEVRSDSGLFLFVFFFAAFILPLSRSLSCKKKMNGNEDKSRKKQFGMDGQEKK